ncbi:hypothetical protein OsJ_10834 [Oryza sativa Japonica Group]|uniref:Uncharacterized protein n=1 Tax=Oryza sativa subsp. japonica TaxID=39947 RepID=B9F8F8_ORYSJ|nr:hypothetical protein OsJ_10834 [Oryza sativa Japonica Group]
MQDVVAKLNTKATQQLPHRRRGVIVAELAAQATQQRRLHNHSDTKAMKVAKAKSSSDIQQWTSAKPPRSHFLYTASTTTPRKRLQHVIVARRHRTPSASPPARRRRNWSRTARSSQGGASRLDIRAAAAPSSSQPPRRHSLYRHRCDPARTDADADAATGASEPPLPAHRDAAPACHNLRVVSSPVADLPSTPGPRRKPLLPTAKPPLPATGLRTLSSPDVNLSPAASRHLPAPRPARIWTGTWAAGDGSVTGLRANVVLLARRHFRRLFRAPR